MAGIDSQTTIAGLARTGGVGVETVRYYQRRGLLRTPEPSGGSAVGGGIRRYGDEDVRRLSFIRQAQVAGFTLEEIAELLALDSSHDHSRARRLAQNRIARLDVRIAELQTARNALARLALACSDTESGPCPILQAFEQK